MTSEPAPGESVASGCSAPARKGAAVEAGGSDIVAQLRARAEQAGEEAHALSERADNEGYGYLASSERGRARAFAMVLEWLDELSEKSKILSE